MPIKGERVYLTAVDESSLEQLRAWRNRSELRRYFREHREISQQMQDKWFKERVLGNPDQYDFEIHENGFGKFIGHCGLYYVNRVNRSAEFTIYIGDDEHRGRGCGSDALRTLFRYGFETLGLHRIWCEVFSNNAAINVYRRLGFVDEGVLREHHYDEGRFWDCHILSMLRREWDERCGVNE